MTTEQQERDWVEEVGKPAYEAIAEMVTALKADRGRLEELREERDDWQPSAEDIPDDWPVEPLDEHDEAESLCTCGECGLSWDDGKVTSMTPAPSARCPFEDFHGPSGWADANPDEAQELAELELDVTLDGEEVDEVEARERIMEDPLSLRIFGERTGGEWEATNYELLLTTGGPAVRIVGDLDEHDEAASARLEVQDWFKPWTEYASADDDVLMAYVGCFYFG